MTHERPDSLDDDSQHTLMREALAIWVDERKGRADIYGDLEERLTGMGYLAGFAMGERELGITILQAARVANVAATRELEAAVAAIKGVESVVNSAKPDVTGDARQAREETTVGSERVATSVD
jgi:hypothetical protein